MKVKDRFFNRVLEDKELDAQVKAIAEEEAGKVLPATTGASAGQVLTLDSNKKPKWGSAPAGGTQIVPFATTYVDVGDDFPDTKSGVENYEPPANKSYAGLPLAFIDSDASKMLSLCGGILPILYSPQIGSNYTIESINDIPNNFISIGVNEEAGFPYCVLKSPSGRFYVTTIAWN